MREYLREGTALRLKIKELVLDFMKNNEDCEPNATGISQAEIFRSCGLDWGDLPNAKSNNQHYWVQALLQETLKDGLTERDTANKKWRIKQAHTK